LKRKPKPEKLVKQPGYAGGKAAMDEFIRNNLKYPDEAIKNNTEGAVAIEYTVDVFGKVLEAKIKHGIGSGCDEEAIRLVKLLQYEKKKYQGLHVVFHKSIIINFHLNTALVSAKKSELNINYQMVQTKNSVAATIISYTIIPENKK
jgi:protein TonB